MTNNHTGRTDDEEWSSTEFLNCPERDGRGTHVHEGGDQTDQERVRDGAELLEEGRAEVEDEVDTGPLLHHLQRCAEDGPAQIAGGLEQSALEAVEPGAEVSTLRDDLHLVFVVGNNFGQLLLDILGIRGLTTKTGQHDRCFVHPSLLDEVSRRFRQEQKADAQDQGPGELNPNGDSIRSRIIAVLGRVIDAGGQKQTDRDAELVAGHNGPTDLAGRNFGHVENDDGGHEAHPEPGNETAGHHEAQSVGRDLEDDTDDEHKAPEDDGGPAAKEVGQITRYDGAKECTGRQDGGDQGLIGRGQREGGHGGGGCIGRGIWDAGDQTDEVGHALHPADVSGVEAEEDTPKGGEGTHEVGLGGHRRLDAVDVRRRHHNRASRHDEGGCGGHVLEKRRCGLEVRCEVLMMVVVVVVVVVMARSDAWNSPQRMDSNGEAEDEDEDEAGG